MARSVKIQKRPSRSDRENAILISLVETYIKTRKPVGSQTLQEAEFNSLSSATIRNYFASMEEEGYIKQQHASGGRIPEAKAYVEYAKHCYDLFSKEKPKKEAKSPSEPSFSNSDVVGLLEQTAEKLSQTVKAAVAITSPRFDHDAITDLRFVFIDIQRCLCVILTEFGLVHTSLVRTPFSLTHALLRNADRFSRYRLFNEPQEPSAYSEEELSNIRFLYQEAMARYIVNYSSVSDQDLWRTGFSRLTYTQVDSVEDITSMVSLLENTNALRGFSKEAIRSGHLRFWIGEELLPYSQGNPTCSLIVMPYCVGEKAVGALSIICPMQVQYLQMFRTLRDTATYLTQVLTNVLLHHKISYRMTESTAFFGSDPHQLAIDFYKNPLLTYTSI
jgi:heat-inducible transcriptional repressor